MKVLFFALILSVMGVVRPALADSVSDENEVAVVFRDMRGDLERCFTGASGNAFVMVEALIDSAGGVRDVTTTSDGRAGEGARRCIERRVHRARFPAPRGGGTSRVRVSFVFARE